MFNSMQLVPRVPTPSWSKPLGRGAFGGLGDHVERDVWIQHLDLLKETSKK